MTKPSVSGPGKVLAIDVGGSHVKVMTDDLKIKREFASGPNLTAKEAVRKVLKLTNDWHYDAVAVGYPGTVQRDCPAADPVNLGSGWKGFDFAKAFDRPTKVVNDALLQAIGAYEGGKMLFIGLGTGLGSAMIVSGTFVPMELGHLPYRKGKSFEDYVGEAGLKRYGKKKWSRHVEDVVPLLVDALEPEYVVIGGGNADKLAVLPKKSRLGSNADAFRGGFRLWQRPQDWK